MDSAARARAIATTVGHLVRVLDEGPPISLESYFAALSDEVALLHDAEHDPADNRYDILARIAAETIVMMEVTDLGQRQAHGS